MRYIELIEAPIEDVTLHGDFDKPVKTFPAGEGPDTFFSGNPDSGRFEKSDANVFKNPNYVKYLKGAWGKITFLFILILLILTFYMMKIVQMIHIKLNQYH